MGCIPFLYEFISSRPFLLIKPVASYPTLKGTADYPKAQIVNWKRAGLSLALFPYDKPFNCNQSRQEYQTENVGGTKADGMGYDPSEKRP